MVKLAMQADSFEQLKLSYGFDSLLATETNALIPHYGGEPLWQEDTATMLREMLQG